LIKGKGAVSVQEKVEVLERLAAMWRVGTLTDDEFHRQKSELLSGIGTVACTDIQRNAGRVHFKWKTVGIPCVALAAAALLLLVARQTTSKEPLPPVLAPASNYEADGQPWSRVEEVPATFQGQYGDCRLGSVELTAKQNIMHWTGDPPRVLETYRGIYVSGDRLLVDGSPDAIVVYEKSPRGGLVMLKQWWSDPKLGSYEGPKENPACSSPLP
jgi:hypothetical protein